jgi:hypothetical protein
MKTNKEVMESLTEYFNKQDHATVSRILASYIVDMNRIHIFEKLPETEKKCLQDRMAHNIRQLHQFIKNGENGDLKIKVFNSNDN